MKNKYIDLIEQAFELNQEEFTITDGNLNWFGIPLMDHIIIGDNSYFSFKEKGLI